MTVNAMTEAASKNQMGQPAAWMMAYKRKSPYGWNQRLQTVSASLPPGKESATGSHGDPVWRTGVANLGVQGVICVSMTCHKQPSMVDVRSKPSLFTSVVDNFVGKLPQASQSP
jgi:hypothetical protein